MINYPIVSVRVIKNVIIPRFFEDKKDFSAFCESIKEHFQPVICRLYLCARWVNIHHGIVITVGIDVGAEDARFGIETPGAKRFVKIIQYKK